MSTLTPQALDTFHERGFVVISGVFTAAEIDEMRAAFDRLAEEAARLPAAGMHRGSQFVITPGDPVRIHRVVWCGAAEPVLSRYGQDPRLVRIAATLLDSPVLEQLINQAHFKLPGDEVAFPWHQDSVHRRHGTPEWVDVNGRGSFVELVTALDPMTPENGPLCFVPGTQRLGHVSAPDGSLPDGIFDPADAVVAELAPGDLVAFGPFVVHGSGPNRGTTPRRTFLNGFALPGANHRVYPGEGAGRTVRV